ncbi:DUF6571 family protein [Streptomyces ipomoeae]|uniref:DUF6571 domain-containing protein n=1 Tax=Streptomyces ipomoeae 91-03 TaxID=698759 RepID=L1KZK0_9ACTN|nr:DUF6571 family protein [Streptomyces ipomoeae]EKX65763.1 hypothetical protein STRIP9103_03814 [Streptomyces ipomoeae 91-03]MDX2694025.1 hypothetical protein [Streptomyces ipomoeae]MDX2840418.1 hypothetical protein [Streptomyces ipomoeae]
MDLDALRFANFKLLDDAIEDWSTMVRDLADLKESADKGLRGAANKANWTGENATVSKEFVGKTAGEFEDAYTQAESIRNILRDTRGELKRYQEKLQAAIDRGLKKNLTVTSTAGGGFTVTMNIHPDHAAKGTTVPEHDANDVTALRDEVQKILDDATQSDSSASRVLKALVDQTELGFSDASYKNRDSAADALKQADELAKLAKKSPEDLTEKEFDRLNHGLKKYANDDLFATEFATSLGPRGTLDFWTGVNDPNGPRDLRIGRSDQFDDLQKNLSLTLANASQSDTAGMTEWKNTMVGLVDKPVGRDGGFPLGGQVMSNLMRWGDFDDRFLNSYGDKLIETEKKFTSNGRHGAWQRTGMDPLLNHTGTDSGWDPMTGYLKALSNNPDAATQFFNDTFVTKDEDHDFTEQKDGKEAKRTLTNFDYLFEERDWPQELDSEGEDSIAGRNNLALALEAATTGHPAGELPTADTPAHNEGQAKLFERIVSSISEDNSRLTGNNYMSDSMGQIASEYLPDINRAASDVDPHPDRGDWDGKQAWERIQNLYPVAGSSAEMDHRDVSRFLFAIGQNPEGYAAVEVGQKSYMASLMDYHLNPNLPESQRPHHDLELTVRAIANQSGEVSGTLSMGRNEAVAAAASASDEEYDHAVTQFKNFVSGYVGTGIGIGTSFIATPAVGAGVGGAAGTVTSMVLEQIFKDIEGTAKDDAGPKMGENWEDGQDGNMKYTRRAASEAARAHGLAYPGDVASWAEDASGKGFAEAGIYMRQVGPELLTEI